MPPKPRLRRPEHRTCRRSLGGPSFVVDLSPSDSLATIAEESADQIAALLAANPGCRLRLVEWKLGGSERFPQDRVDQIQTALKRAWDGLRRLCLTRTTPGFARSQTASCGDSPWYRATLASWLIPSGPPASWPNRSASSAVPWAAILGALLRRLHSFPRPWIWPVVGSSCRVPSRGSDLKSKLSRMLPASVSKD
jgi:hypothetical protein